MPSDAYADELNSFRTGALIVCTEEVESAVREQVTLHAAQDWERYYDIVIVAIPRQRSADGVFVTSEVNRTASRLMRDMRLLTVGNISVQRNRLRGQILTSTADQKVGLKTFGRSRLPRALRGLRLDWRSKIIDTVANAWDHGVVDEVRIDAWLRQFDLLGSHGWVGERLLRILDFWPSARIRNCLPVTEARVQNFSHVCVNRRQAGKSADALANKIQKGLGGFTSIRVADFRDVLAEEGEATILYIEDCLLTGTEIVSLLKALVGNVRQGRTPKVPPLDDLELFKRKQVVMHFLVATNLGSEILKSFLLEEQLSNVTLGGAYEQLETLTSQGVQAVHDRSLFNESNCITDPERYVIPLAFQAESTWGGPDRIGRAIKFCGVLGEQLFRNYLSWKQWQWPDCRIREASLGVRGVALALAFAHSVPKATLPLFWMDGPVKFDGKKLQWQPLFPSAA